MEAKEKAYELAMKFDREGETDNAKQCALIVDEILDLDSGDAVDKDFWQEVKQEINNL